MGTDFQPAASARAGVSPRTAPPGGPAAFSLATENREFVRVHTRVRVEFKFFSNFIADPRLARTYTGTTSNVSAGGLLLSGAVPEPGWIPALLLGQIVLGVKIHLPEAPEPVKAMARVAWVEDPGRPDQPYALGLKFREITREGHDRLLGFILDAEL